MKAFLLAVLLLLVSLSCVPTGEVKKDVQQEAAVIEGELPNIVAIMPFQNDTKEIGIANQVRRAFYNHFSSKPYRDIELAVVDEKVVQLERSSGKHILDLNPSEICASIGCSGLIFGKITDYKKVYAGIYSQLGIEAEVWMINTKTGKEVFRMKEAVRYHEGGVPTSPLGLIMTAVSTARNIRELQQVRMVNELVYKFNEKIPSPQKTSIEERPLIKEVLTNAKEGPFTKGKIIRVGLEGEKGLVATFDIGNFKKGISMKETKPGIYMGEYLVLPGDNTKDMPIIVSLKRIGGLENEWIDVSGFVTIDTTPPPPVSRAKAKGFQDRIEIAWEPLKNIPDLAGYKVLRSEQPLSGYSEITTTELNAFDDKTAKPSKTYYYRVIAFDNAGNESEVAEQLKASLISKEPRMLTGEIDKDTFLSGTYLIRGDLIVPKGRALFIEPETRVMFDANSSIIVNGKIGINGKDAPVEFIPVSDNRWKGIVINSAAVSVSGLRIKGADCGMTIENSDGVIEDVVITGSNTALSISGIPSVVVRRAAISENKTGIELQKTDAKIVESNIFHNSNGIVINGFSGEIRDNNIFNNDKNISSKGALKIGANYLGSINTDEMRINSVIVAKTYDNRLPGGKIVDAISNPYESMTHEERRKKAAELVIEAGNNFRQRNYGKAVILFEEALKALPTADVYYYIALCYQEMKEEEKALRYLREGVQRFPNDSTLQKSLGLLYYQKGDEARAKKAFEEVMRLSPEDRQVRFLMERMGK